MVVRFGSRTEQWINLFGAADRLEPEVAPQGADVLLDGLDGLMRHPARRDEAKARVQSLIERLRTRPGRPDNPR